MRYSYAVMPSSDDVPQFRSTIPGELLKALAPEEVYLFEGISRLEQKTDWLIREVIETRRTSTQNSAMLTGLASRVERLEQQQQALMTASERIKSVEDWRSNFTGKWGVLSAGLLLVLTAVVGGLMKVLFDRLSSP